MATCYQCGSSGASHRRTVTTGYSNTRWTSKKSYGSSTRTYHGVRSVCEDCAISIDKANLILSTVLLFLIACGLVYYLIVR